MLLPEEGTTTGGALDESIIGAALGVVKVVLMRLRPAW
jgi:hypothetical protein